MSEREERFRIGRDPGCDVPIADQSVSKLHAILSLLGGRRLFLTDCGSTNGTRLIRQGRQRPVRQEFLDPGDSVIFGDVELGVEELWEAIRRKRPVPDLDGLSRQGRGSSDGASMREGGGRLVRCGCGTVKTKGASCPTCGK